MKNFKIEINGVKPLSEIISKANFDWINPEINERNFPIKIKTKRITKIYLFHFKKFTNSKFAFFFQKNKLI